MCRMPRADSCRGARSPGWQAVARPLPDALNRTGMGPEQTAWAKAGRLGASERAHRVYKVPKCLFL
jgi:hypothetical protein